MYNIKLQQKNHKLNVKHVSYPVRITHKGMRGLTGPQGTVYDSWRSSWNSSVQYIEGDIVSRYGSSYLAVENNLNVDPYQDPTTTVVASAVATANTPLGSPTKTAIAFTVDREQTIGALNINDMVANVETTTGVIAIARSMDFGVPDVMSQATVESNDSGKVVLDNPAILTPGNVYWLVTALDSASVQIATYANLTESHMNYSSTGLMLYGFGGSSLSGFNTSLDNNYGQGVVMYGTVPSSWNLLASTGDEGISAYQTALNNGFTGTELEWLESLVGPEGPTGDAGSGGDKTFAQSFTVTDDVLVVHNLNKQPSVTVIDSAGDEVIGEVEYIDNVQVRVRFASAFSGIVVLN